jgi:hypothetical protein
MFGAIGLTISSRQRRSDKNLARVLIKVSTDIKLFKLL